MMAFKKSARYSSLWSRCEQWRANLGCTLRFLRPFTTGWSEIDSCKPTPRGLLPPLIQHPEFITQVRDNTPVEYLHVVTGSVTGLAQRRQRVDYGSVTLMVYDAGYELSYAMIGRGEA